MANRTISQETFDLAVADNIEAFDMTLEEAIVETKSEFIAQKVDLRNIVMSVEGFSVAKSANQDFEMLRQHIDDENRDNIEFIKLLSSLNEKALENSFAVAFARAGALGAMAYMCTNTSASFSFIHCVSDSKVLRVIVPPAAVKALCEVLSIHRDNNDLKVLAMSAILNLITQHEPHKLTLHESGFTTVIINHLQNFESKSLVQAKFLDVLCSVIRRYLSDDDRRPGVHPMTFMRARELSPHVIRPLLRHIHIAPAAVCGALKLLAVNEAACLLVSGEGFQCILALFTNYAQDIAVIQSACAVLKVIARNDAVKSRLGSGRGLVQILNVLQRYDNDQNVLKQALATLAALTLRANDNCIRLAELGGIPHILDAMRKHPVEVSVQRSAITTLRNLVSNFHTKFLVESILEYEAEALIRSAHDTHKECVDVAFAALRELGRPYTATWANKDE